MRLCLLLAAVAVLPAQSALAQSGPERAGSRAQIEVPDVFGAPSRAQLAARLAQAPLAPDGRPFVSEPVTPILSRPLAEIAHDPPQSIYRARTAEGQLVKDYFGDYMQQRLAANNEGKPATDPLVAAQRAALQGLSLLAPALPPIIDFEGLAGTESGGFAPPDPVIAVSASQIVEMVNVRYAVYDKSGTRLAGPINTNALWAGTGQQCANYNSGDPIVMYDEVNGRWLLTQFRIDTTNQIHGMCIAVSTADDALGTYYLYDFPFTNFVDYPKLGIWPGSYTLSTVDFTATGGAFVEIAAYAFEQAQMIAGNPARFVRFGGTADGLRGDVILPAEVDGLVQPPPGTPALFYDSSFFSTVAGGGDDVKVYGLDVDWSNPSAATFTAVATIPITPFSRLCAGSRSCIPQPGSGANVDALSSRVMNRGVYRNLGTYQAMAGTFTVDAGGGQAAPRWFELRNTGSGWTLHQEGTYAPDGLNRWMAAAAFDDNGGFALGYSVSDASTNPGLRYTHQTSGTALGVLNEEAVMEDGGGVQTGTNRWGDYSALVPDPSNNQLWFVGEYIRTNVGFDWHTRIGAFSLDVQPLKLVSAGDPTINAGETGTFDFDIEVFQNTAAATLEATLPAIGTYVGGSATCTDGTTGTQSGGMVTWALVGLTAGNDVSCSFEMAYPENSAEFVFVSFQDDHEDGTGGWTTTAVTGADGWTIAQTDASTPPNHWFVPDVGSVQEHILETASPLVPGDNAVLQFNHRYDTENGYDGGVMEISTDGGATWADLGGAMIENGYSGRLSTCCGNPLGGRQAFEGHSGGYITTWVDLSAFSGQSVLFRFRFGSDDTVSGNGWFVDELFALSGGGVDGTGTAQSTATLSDGSTTLTTTSTRTITVTRRDVEQPVSSSGLVSFNDAGEETAVDIDFTALTGTGTVRVTYVKMPSANPQGISDPERLNAYWKVEVIGGPITFGPDTEFRIDLSEIGGSGLDPTKITGYKRDAEGSGAFAALTTAYDATSGEIVLTGFTEFSEFTLAGTPGALPVELTAFDARLDGADALLTWETASETNNAGFDVQMATQPGVESWDPEAGASFVSQGFVPGAGTVDTPQNYTFRVANLTPGTYRFRLEQTDFDGASVVFQEVELVVGIPQELAITEAYPNPAHDRVRLAFTVPSDGNATLALFDVLGRKVLDVFAGDAQTGRYHYAEVDTRGLPAGVYVARLRTDGGAVSRSITVVD